MRILTTAASSIAWQDVLDYCNLQLPESTTLDYKLDFPKELERTIAAMANTSGGLVLIGVREDPRTTKPLMPPDGVPLDRGLAERITSICITTMSPPLVPEIAVVADPSASRAVIVVRVPQSHQAPHAVARSTQVYLRRGLMNSPEALATIDELEWLKGGRQRAVSFRESLLQRADERFRQFLQGFDGSVTKPQKIAKDGMLSLSFCPTYPKEMMVDPPNLHFVLRDIRVRDYYRTDHEFPLGSINGVIVQDGYIVHAAVDGGDWVHHTELNSFGLIFFKQSLLHRFSVNKVSLSAMRASEVFCRLDEMFDCAQKFYQRIGFSGALVFKMRLENLVGHAFGRYSSDEMGLDRSYTPDEVVEFSHDLDSNDIAQRKSPLILAAARRVAWAFDWDVDAALLNRFYVRSKGTAVI
jgi:hypothetical protein